MDDFERRDTSESSVILGVRLMAAWIVLGAFWRFVAGGAALGFGSGAGLMTAIFSAAYIGLGLGIFMLMEAARQVYVWLAVIGIVLSVVGAGVSGLLTGGLGVAVFAGLFVAVIPLYILTRPSVKRVFH